MQKVIQIGFFVLTSLSFLGVSQAGLEGLRQIELRRLEFQAPIEVLNVSEIRKMKEFYFGLAEKVSSSPKRFSQILADEQVRHRSGQCKQQSKCKTMEQILRETSEAMIGAIRNANIQAQNYNSKSYEPITKNYLIQIAELAEVVWTEAQKYERKMSEMNRLNLGVNSINVLVKSVQEVNQAESVYLQTVENCLIQKLNIEQTCQAQALDLLLQAQKRAVNELLGFYNENAFLALIEDIELIIQNRVAGAIANLVQKFPNLYQVNFSSVLTMARAANEIQAVIDRQENLNTYRFYMRGFLKDFPRSMR